MVIAGQNVCVVTAVHPDHGTEVVGVLLSPPKDDEVLWDLLKQWVEKRVKDHQGGDLCEADVHAQLNNYTTPEWYEVATYAQPTDPPKVITAISMYRGHDAEQFVQLVDGRLTPEQRRAWRDAHGCDPEDADEDDDDLSNMFFREFAALVPNDKLADLTNVDGENHPPHLPENLSDVQGNHDQAPGEPDASGD